MALRSLLSKRETFIEKNKHADASHPTPKAKPKAKVNAKAKAKAAKVPASVLFIKNMNNEQRDSDGI